jgi:hypothetical protein
MIDMVDSGKERGSGLYGDEESAFQYIYGLNYCGRTMSSTSTSTKQLFKV